MVGAGRRGQPLRIPALYGVDKFLMDLDPAPAVFFQPALQFLRWRVCADLAAADLKAFGVRTDEQRVARDGGDAVDKAGQCRPDAIVLDMMMPVMDGQQVLRRLREDTATANIPVVMLTARRQERDIIDTLELGADDYLVKPFIPEELMTRLARVMAMRR